MSLPVLVIGGSEQGRQTIDILELDDRYQVVGVLDASLQVDAEVEGYPVLGGDESLEPAAAATGARGFLVAIGDNFTRGRILARERAANPQLELVRAVHPSAVVARSAVVGPGAIVLAGAIVSNDANLGAGVLLGTKASLEHDSELGACASLAPNATTGGAVRIGDYTAVGLGANIVHGVSIGDHTVVGAGALVLTDLPDHVVAFGVPARVQRGRTDDEPYLTPIGLS
jgi:sugar O-acyltransferase (sialic acid O-acetyltransferase NeuD family)